MDTTQTDIPRKLYKSRRDRMIDGVCGGIAEYFDVDPTIVRIVWILVTLMGGTGLILYIAGMIIIPVNPDIAPLTSSSVPPVRTGDNRRFWGIMLILAGATFLLINLGWYAGFHWWAFSRSVVMPLLLIGVGGLLIYIHSRRGSAAPAAMAADGSSAADAGVPVGGADGVRYKELRRSTRDKKLFGVCGGLAAYFNVDSTIVRILYICLVIASSGWGLLLYILLALLMPEERPMTSTT
jgi:phage shock protein C